MHIELIKFILFCLIFFISTWHVIQRREECSVCSALLSPPPCVILEHAYCIWMITKRVRLLKCVVYCCWLNPNHPWLNPWIHYILDQPMEWIHVSMSETMVKNLYQLNWFPENYKLRDFCSVYSVSKATVNAYIAENKIR